ncbi:hypothetical protein TRAPUB_12967 [Trametes pubescens]|uniref:Uncharacterized protein n=1 Tax=Trametes pubescens TaxID=154538 RepID=A0A1M2VSD5_TRAPU|nr:hypothetical protein TRAPUB_12967 [Trametes pubescens]
MDAPERDTPPHPPLTQPPPPPCTQPRRLIDKRAKTQLPAEKSKAKLLMKAGGQSGGQTARGPNQSMLGNSESFRLAGTSNVSPDESQDERDATPTPPEKTRKGDACLVSSGGPPAPAESEYDDPYGLRNTSHSQDPAYEMGGNEWAGMYGHGKDAEGQTDVCDHQQRPRMLLTAQNEQTEEEGARDDEDPFLSSQAQQEKPRGSKRQRLESPSTPDEQVVNPPLPPAHASPYPAHPAPPAQAQAADGQVAVRPNQLHEGRPDAAQQGQGHGDALPPYPPPPQANPVYQYQLAPHQQFLSQLQQLQVQQLQPQQTQFQTQLQQQAQQQMIHAPVPAIMNALQLQLQPQQPHNSLGLEASQQGPRNSALLFDEARKHRREAALKLAKKWCITPEYADDVIGMV